LLWELEETLARFVGAEFATVFSTAYIAMITVLSCLTRFGKCFVFYDELSHMCVLDALNGLGPNVIIVKYGHNDANDLRLKVESHVSVRDRDKFKVVVSDSLFGMDGSIFDLPSFDVVAKDYGLTLLLDEAHTIGVLGAAGRGIEEHFDMPGSVHIRLGGMNKGMPLLGGWVATSSSEVAQLLKFRCHGVMFTGTLPPPALATAKAAIEVLETEPEHVRNLKANTVTFVRMLREAGFELSKHAGKSPIIIVPIHSDAQLLSMYNLTRDANVQIFVAMFPAVPRGKGRIRICAQAGHTTETICKIVDVLKQSAQACGVKLENQIAPEDKDFVESARDNQL